MNPTESNPTFNHSFLPPLIANKEKVTATLPKNTNYLIHRIPKQYNVGQPKAISFQTIMKDDSGIQNDLEYERIPGINGIAIFIEKEGNDSASNNILLTAQEAISQKIPIIISTSLVKRAIQNLNLSKTALEKSYSLFLSVRKSFCILIPKGASHVCLRDLGLSSNLEKVESISNWNEKQYILNHKVSYEDLANTFQKSPIKPRLAFYISGHGLRGSTASLKDSDYRSLIHLLDNVYSISACYVSSCNSHGEEPLTSQGPIIRKGIPNITTLFQSDK
jgi:hypothetical protein